MRCSRELDAPAAASLAVASCRSGIASAALCLKSCHRKACLHSLQGPAPLGIGNLARGAAAGLLRCACALRLNVIPHPCFHTLLLFWDVAACAHLSRDSVTCRWDDPLQDYPWNPCLTLLLCWRPSSSS